MPTKLAQKPGPLLRLWNWILDTLEFRPPPKIRRGVEQQAIDKVIIAWGYHPDAADAKMDRENVRNLATRAVRELRNQGWTPPNQ